MIPPKQYVARLADKVQVNDKFVHFKFELEAPHVLSFEAGQYISIGLPTGHRRSYSLCSSPEMDHGFELLVDLAPNGMGVQYLNALKFGDAISILAPLGKFIIDEKAQNSPLHFLATGSGIAPFRSMIFDQLQLRHSTQPMTLYWGMRFVEQMFWENEFEELAIDFPNFHFHPVISQAIPQWPLCRGRVTDCLQVHTLMANAHYYICGNPKMLADTIAILQQKEIPPTNVHFEKFF
jgi:ferredoxin-NADP reductase